MNKNPTPSKSPVNTCKFLDVKEEDNKNFATIPVSPRVLNLEKVENLKNEVQRKDSNDPNNKENVYKGEGNGRDANERDVRNKDGKDGNNFKDDKKIDNNKNNRNKIKKNIPAFYTGKKYNKNNDMELRNILPIFKKSVNKQIFTDNIIKNHLKLPKFFGPMLFDKISKGKSEIDSNTFLE